MRKPRPFIVTIRVPVLASSAADARKVVMGACRTAFEVTDVKPLTKRNRPKSWRAEGLVLQNRHLNFRVTLAECLQGVPK
jgi:hypothetical protein